MCFVASGVHKVKRPLICFPLSRFDLGGLERVQMHIATGLGELGFQEAIVTSKVKAEAEPILKSGALVLPLGGGRVIFLFRLFHWLRKNKPELIITSANDIGCIVLLFRSFFLKKSKVVWTQHLSISGPLASSKRLKWIKLLLDRWLMRRLVKFSDLIVAVSNSVAEDMRLQISPDLPVRVIYNPVIFEGFEQHSREKVDWPWADQLVPTVVFVGRLAPVKRLDRLIQAFGLCAQWMPARLLVVGDGPELDRAKRMVADRALEEVCRFIGYCRNPLPWIRQADVLVLCSDAEGFGVVLVEAMACGTQVVSTDCPSGPAEVLGSGRYGRLVPVEDVNALATAIHKSLQVPYIDPEELKRRAADFSVQCAVLGYEKALRSLEGGS